LAEHVSTASTLSKFFDPAQMQSLIEMRCLGGLGHNAELCGEETKALQHALTI